MTNPLYLYLIYPIEVLMRLCLEGVYFVTHSYGLAIVLLSVCISFLTLPLYLAAERWQQEERRIKSMLSPGLQHIKKAFRGQERFAMIQTLYRQHDYHPVMALRASLGLLIQIPFFFAAYHFISHYQPLDGVSFAWFENLASPDRLLQIGGFSINAMPFLMTGVNLCSAHVYGRKLEKREKIQLYLLAAVFLVLLYNSPVALVLYWTINNVFSLGKNLIERRGAPVPGASLATESIRKITLPPTGLITIAAVTLVAVGLLLLDAVPAPLVAPTTFATYALLLYLSVAATGVFMRSFHPTPTRLLRAFLLVALYASLLFSLFEALSSYQHFSALDVQRYVIWSGFVLIIVLSLPNFSFSAERFVIDVREPTALFLLSSTLIVVVLCVFSPISLFASDPTQFSTGVLDVLRGTTLIAFVMLAILLAIYSTSSKRLRGSYAFLMTCTATIASLYTFVLVGDYGSIDFFTLDEQTFLTPLLLALDVFVSGVVGMAVYFLFQKGQDRHIKQLLSISIATTLLVSGYQLHAMDAPLHEGRVETRESPHGLSPLPDYNEHLMNFSAQGKNVVVIMLDAFNAYTLPISFEREPTLLQALDGFTWFRNTLTTGYVTALGEPGIHGGHRYTPLEIQKREYTSVTDEAARGYRVFSDSFGDEGFDVSYAGVQNTRCEPIVRYSRVPPRVCVDSQYIIDYGNSVGWPGHENRPLANVSAGARDDIDYDRILTAVGIFRAAPFSLKELVYGKGTWLNTFPLARRNLKGATNAGRNLSALLALSQASEASSAKSTFKYIQNNLTHRPFFLDAESCLPALTESHDEAARDCALRALARWLGWLEVEGIYDNTMIVLVSDHGSRRFGSKLGIQLTRTNALLMVKDFDQRGPLEQSDVFMSNADVPSIVCTAIGGCPGIADDPRQASAPRTLYFVKGNNKQNHLHISPDNVVYRVENSIFEPENWSIVK